MTTLVAIRQPLEVVSMSKQPDGRTGKRLAAAADYEHDDDFTFVRKSKKPKTTPTTTTTTTTTSTTSQPGITNTYRDAANTSTAGPSRSRKKFAEIPDSPPEFPISKRGTRPAPQDEERLRAQNRDISPELPPQGTKVALPMSDTPIINRNKEMRKQAGSSNRRSSLGKRGRRASSLIDSGQAAIPHREVSAADFYKHISASEGLPEPRRMKQLLTWCGQRALPEKPKHNTPNANVILGALAIQDLILQDLSTRADCTNWFNRDENAPRTRFLKPNPKNLELDAKVATLQGRIKRLQEEKEAWVSMRQPPADQPSLFDEEDEDVNADGESISISLPDFDLLDPEEGKMRTYLLSELEPFDSVCSRTEERIRNVQQSLEFEVDQLADNMHKLEQRVLAASQEADRVLALSATRLKDREDREKRSAGTKEMPMMEVLRGLGRILPEGS